jgi:hypothetical protein
MGRKPIVRKVRITLVTDSGIGSHQEIGRHVHVQKFDLDSVQEAVASLVDALKEEGAIFDGPVVK